MFLYIKKVKCMRTLVGKTMCKVFFLSHYTDNKNEDLSYLTSNNNYV